MKHSFELEIFAYCNSEVIYEIFCTAYDLILGAKALNELGNILDL